jgi:hypothetical protein
MSLYIVDLCLRIKDQGNVCDNGERISRVRANAPTSYRAKVGTWLMFITTDVVLSNDAQ